MIKRALLRLESGFERILVGRREPTPKSIRDLGKTVNQARPVQLVIEGLNLPVLERTDVAQLGRTAVNRWDDMGNYTVDL
jgi:hypothetical protein